MRQFTELSQFHLGDMVVQYLVDQDQQVTWQIYPASCADQATLPTQQNTTIALVQAKLAGDDYDKNFSNGLTMLNSATSRSMRLQDQQHVTQPDGSVKVTTTLTDAHGNVYTHYATWVAGSARLQVQVEFESRVAGLQRLEWLPSFCLTGISPFYGARIPAGTLNLIRLRSKWAMEGRIEQRPIEEYDLEPSWKPSGLALEQFGQNGTMPVRGFFPFIGLRDRTAAVTWLAELAGQASWQLNVGRLDDRLVMFGGLPDADDGHWYVDLAEGEHYTTPVAFLTVGQGELLTVSRRLQSPVPATTKLPIIYNEWGTSWGHPSAALVHESVALLQDHPVDYYVVDAGWYKLVDNNWDGSHGDWQVDLARFPGGLAKTVQDIHAHGLKAGLWYEMETVGLASTKAQDTAALVHYRQNVVSTIKRRFLDLRLPAVHQYLQTKVVAPLAQAGFDYLKIDYNDNVGVGADHADSGAAGLEQITTAMLQIIKDIRRQLPGITIENCASGGHRLTPAYIDTTDVSSFSDAHETYSIPIIAANELNIIPAAKNLIWCVVHPEDTEQALYFHLIATFLGRVCLSGDIRQLTAGQWSIIDRCLQFYQRHAQLIATGQPFRQGPDILSYHDPVGWQLSGFADDQKKLILLFGFNLPRDTVVELPVDTHWKLVDEVGSQPEPNDNPAVTIPKHAFWAHAWVYQRA